MFLRFVKLNPSGNVTVIVLTPVERGKHRDVAAEIMRPYGLGAEQVGFAERSSDANAIARLQMMGDEFCGNACRAFGAWLMSTSYLGRRLLGDEVEIPIETSGYDGVLAVRGREQESGLWVSSPMPLPRRIEFLPFKHGYLGFVELPGISHAVVWDQKPSVGAFWEIAEFCKYRETQAFGVMFLDESERHVVPAVWVKETESLVWEGSCASGSIAVASVLAARDGVKTETLELGQPGGSLLVRVESDGRTGRAEISGFVHLVACGRVWVNGL